MNIRWIGEHWYYAGREGSAIVWTDRANAMALTAAEVDEALFAVRAIYGDETDVEVVEEVDGRP